MTHDEDGRLAAWLGDSFDSAPVAALEEAFARARMTRQRAAWMVNLTGGTVAQRPAIGQLRFSLILAIVALVGLLAGAVIVGGVLRPKPAPVPIVSASPTEPAQPKPAMYVFSKGTGTSAECGNDGRGGCIPRLWVANLDGTGAHELLPDQSGCQRFQAWSPDGTRLLFSRSECTLRGENGMTGVERFYLTDASGSEPQVVNTGCASNCQAEDDAVFSSDGRQILFVRTKSVPVPPSATPDPVTGKPPQGTEVRVLASIDLGTGRVTELGDFDECYQSCEIQSPRSYPLWSPDRTQIVFTGADLVVGPQPPADPAVFVADFDGRNVHQVSAFGQSPGWSPDGTRIVFQGDRYSWTGTWFPGKVVRSSSDIYTIRPDGTDLRRLTTDEISSNPGWSVDGRIWFLRLSSVDGNVQTEGPLLSWVMDADGSNATQLSGPPPFQEWQLQPTP
jgi:Tol biopolymer transport system component